MAHQLLFQLLAATFVRGALCADRVSQDELLASLDRPVRQMLDWGSGACWPNRIHRLFVAQGLLDFDEAAVIDAGKIRVHVCAPVCVPVCPFCEKELDRICPVCACIVLLFLDDLPDMLAEIADAVSQRDQYKLERSAHSLKGSVGSLAAHRAFETAMRLEVIGRDGDFDALEVAHADLLREIQALERAMGAFLSEEGEEV